MDLSTLPDIAQHFAIAIHMGPDFMQHGLHEVESVVLAFAADSDMGPAEKIYHAGKSIVLSGLFVASIMTANVEGMIGTGLAQVDEYYYLRKEGEHVRIKRCPPVVEASAPHVT